MRTSGSLGTPSAALLIALLTVLALVAPTADAGRAAPASPQPSSRGGPVEASRAAPLVQVDRGLRSLRPVLTDAELVASTTEDARCRRRPVAPLPSARAAVRDTWRWVRSREGRRNTDRLRTRLQRMRADDVAALAARAVGTRRPRAALVAELVLVQRFPQEPLGWLNAANLLVALDRPRAAYPLATAAPRPSARAQVGGIPLRAVGAASRGWALLGLGRHEAAWKELQAASKAAPALTEAARGAAQAAVCGRQPAPTVARLARRATGRVAPTTTVTDEQGRGAQLPTELLGPAVDDPGMQPMRLNIPATLASAKTEGEALLARSQTETQRAMQLDRANIDFLRTKVLPAERGWPFGYEPWHGALFTLTSQAAETPGLRALRDAEREADLRRDAAWEWWVGGELSVPTSDECPDMIAAWRRSAGALADWVSARQALDAAVYDERLRIARLSANPLRRQYFRLRAQVSATWARSTVLGRLGQDALLAGSWGSRCETVEPPAVENDYGEVDEGEPLDCPSWAQVNIDLEFIEVTLDCEKIETVLQQPGPVGAFIAAEQAWGSQAVTVYTGVQGKLGVSVLKAEAKAGVYVTFDDTGVVDAGARVKAETKVVSSNGVLKVQASGGPEWKRSFFAPAGPVEAWRD